MTVVSVPLHDVSGYRIISQPDRMVTLPERRERVAADVVEAYLLDRGLDAADFTHWRES